MARVAAQKGIALERLQDVSIDLVIEGLSPVIPHRWSEKARRMILDKHMGKPKAKKEPKDPEADAEASLYKLEDGTLGLPATAFKAATVEAARFFDGITMTLAQRAIFIEGDGPEMLVPIQGERHFREDWVRNDSGVVDLRHRYGIWPWTATVTVRYIDTQFTADAVVALVDAGGRNGVGDWRPSSPKNKAGTFGTYRVVEST